MDATIKKIPYGMTNFESIICDNYYYVDKTHYITKVENTSRFFFFVRPRRFGKSLFLSMLSHYYDINQKDKFDKIFGELYIGKHPTPDRNKYLVLALNFSSVASSMERLEESFNTYCKIVMTGFAERNAHLLGEEAVEKLRELKTGDALLGSLCQSANSKGQKIYLILDEYDNFANNILVDYGNERYRSITHGSGFFRGFLKVVKDYSNSVIERIFLTGVSPVTMDDLTSGFNIAANYSNSPTFNNMMGFNFTLTALQAGTVCLALNCGAYMAEIIRAGILSVDSGQMEAARSLGLPYSRAMIRVVLPQAIRTMIPSIINQFIITLKDTSILSVIGFPELVNTAKNVVANSFMSFQTWGIVAVMYLIVITILSKVAKIVERRLNRGRK